MHIGPSLSLTGQQGAPSGGAAPIDPLTLFSGGEQGGLFLPKSQDDTLFSSRSEATQANSGGPVGIALSVVSFGGLSSSAFIAAQPELVAANWTAGTNWTQNSAGNYTANNVAANSEVSRSGLLSANTWYVCDLTWSGIPTNGLTWRLYALQFTTLFTLDGLAHGASGSRRLIFRAPSSGTVTALRALSNNMSGNFTLSIKALTGLHALAASDAVRPLYHAAGNLDFDGLDDLLSAITPNLGASCSTVTVTDLGVDIQTGVTIGAGTYNLPTSDWYAHIFINRALTAQEQAGLTAWGQTLVAA